MSNSEKISNIKSTIDRLKAGNPKGILELAQTETQIIITEELIKANDNLYNILTTLENIETAIKQK